MGQCRLSFVWLLQASFCGFIILSCSSSSSSHLELCHAAIACKVTADCQTVLLFAGDAECVNGICSNPFRRGCLQAMDRDKGTSHYDKEDFGLRVCNSDDAHDDEHDDEHDDDDSEASSLSRGCRIPNFPFETYNEIRIAPGDWESSIFFSWIIQIILSEILHVPVTIETSAPSSAGSLSFYDPRNGLVYPSVPYNYKALQRSLELKNADCTQANRTSGTDACAHILPEVWSGQIDAYTAALQEGYIEPPEGNGMVGEFSFMIPHVLAEQDPSLTSWHGLQNRTKMAALFERPTTWLDYCTLVVVDDSSSNNHCAVPNDVAMRYPETLEEESSYFVAGLYQGYFRPTDQNNCTKYPDTCTGHVVDPPCHWDTITTSQMYWNNIALESSGPLLPNHGYSYFQMIQIWHAANATQSPVFMWWWKPDSLDQLYFNTSYALQPVFLPPPSECEKNRVSSVDQCSNDYPTAQLGSTALGSCDFPPHSLQKVMSTSLLLGSTTVLPQQSMATQSPAYQFLKLVRVSDLSLTIMLRNWSVMNVDRYGIDPRLAVCEWVYDNLDEMVQTILPIGYPRELEDQESSNQVLWIASLSLACLAFLLAFGCLIGTIVYRNNLIFKYAHVPFVIWVLMGLMMVATGALLMAPHPITNSICRILPYLTTLGYTIELMPLVVKVSAINHLISESQRMRKVQLDTNRLHLQVSGVAGFVLIFLMLWSFLDPPTVVETAHLVQQGEPLVRISMTCQSQNTTDAWVMATYAWQGLLLLSAMILAIQSRTVRQEFNESQSLAMMVYSHVLFLILRAVLYMLPPENFTSSHSQAGWMSLCLSLDAINTVLVYFAPKWYAIVRHKDVRIRMTTASSNRRCPPNHQSPFPRYNGTRDSAVLSTNNGGGRKRSWLSHMGERSRWSSNNNMMDSQKTIDFEEPPPSSDELKLLMGEVFDFLAAAAAIQDDLKRSTLLPQVVLLSTGGQGIGESNGKEHEFQGQIDGKGDKDDDNDSGELPNKDTYFMKKDELLLFRSICRRIGKARFDFESRFHNHMSQPQPQLPLPQQKLLQQQQQHQEGRGDVGYNAVALLGGGKGSGSPSFLISPRSSSLFMSGRI